MGGVVGANTLIELKVVGYAASHKKPNFTTLSGALDLRYKNHST